MSWWARYWDWVLLAAWLVMMWFMWRAEPAGRHYRNVVADRVLVDLWTTSAVVGVEWVTNYSQWPAVSARWVTNR